MEPELLGSARGERRQGRGTARMAHERRRARHCLRGAGDLGIRHAQDDRVTGWDLIPARRSVDADARLSQRRRKDASKPATSDDAHAAETRLGDLVGLGGISHFVPVSGGEDGSPRFRPVHSERVAAGFKLKDTALCAVCDSPAACCVGDET